MVGGKCALLSGVLAADSRRQLNVGVDPAEVQNAVAMDWTAEGGYPTIGANVTNYYPHAAQGDRIPSYRFNH